MSVKENQELTRWMYEELSKIKGNIGKIPPVIQKFMAPQGVYHGATGDLNYDQYLQYQVVLHTAFPDITMTVEDIFAAGDKVAIRFVIRGTHKGPFLGIPPTGKQINVKAASIARFAGGKAEEGWAFPDMLGMMQQLGVIPARK